MSKILIVEDEESIADLEKDYLELSGFEVEVANDGQTGLDKALFGDFDLVILDLMLPGVDGFEICRKVRAEKNTPIIMVSAKKDDIDKIRGLGLGADDYMTKPFAPEELLARLRAMTRRQGEVVLDEMSFEDLTLNLSTCDLKCGVKSVHLNFKEFEILRLLMANSPQVTTKETLIVKVWGYESGAEDNNVEAYISFLRKKLYFLGSRVGVTVLRKIGYHLEVNM